MADDTRHDFHKRLARLEKTTREKTRAASGERVGVYDYEEELRRKRNKFPWKRLFILLFIGWIGLVAVKAYIVKDMGEEAYQLRLAELREGDRYSQFAALMVSRGPLMSFFEESVFGGLKKVEPETKNAPDETSEAPSNTAN